MALPSLQERSLDELSRIQIRFFLAPSSRESHLEILVIRYSGAYGIGSAGNDDARYMAAMAGAAVSAFSPWGVIHDLSDLSYDWGDMLCEVLGMGPEWDRKGSCVAVVVGPRCEEAVRTLMLGINGNEPVTSAPGVFRSLEDAWDYVDQQVRL